MCSTEKEDVQLEFKLLLQEFMVYIYIGLSYPLPPHKDVGGWIAGTPALAVNLMSIPSEGDKTRICSHLFSVYLQLKSYMFSLLALSRSKFRI